MSDFDGDGDGDGSGDCVASVVDFGSGVSTAFGASVGSDVTSFSLYTGVAEGLGSTTGSTALGLGLGLGLRLGLGDGSVVVVPAGLTVGDTLGAGLATRTWVALLRDPWSMVASVPELTAIAPPAVPATARTDNTITACVFISPS